MTARRRSHWLAGTFRALRPPPILSLSAWADRHYRLSAESSAEPGRWRTRAYQRGLMDAITDPAVERVSVMKSARIGYTLGVINTTIGYHIHHDACPIMAVLPTVDTAKKYSKEFITPMLRDVPVLRGLVKGASVKTSGNTVLDKSFPGGVLSMVGANSGAGFRMSSRRVVIFDEVDAYPPSAGDEGDPIALGENRAQEFWNRKIIAGSTPTIAGASRIEELVEAGDRRRYYVPCPHCGHMDHLTPREENQGGHFMRWDKGQPEAAYFVCRECGCEIEEKHKRAMVDAGEWRAAGEFSGHASFYIWAAYSSSPNATWGQIARAFVDASKGGPEKLRVVINTLFGETWKERGEAPDWDRLYDRRETYAIGSVPQGVIVLTAGVDVQKDRFVYEVVGWGVNKESWSIDAGELFGDTALDVTWLQMDALLDRVFPGADGRDHRIAMLAIDARYNTQEVYGWARKKPMTRVMAVAGIGGMLALVIAPAPVDVTVRGKRMQRGYKAWRVGGDIAKAELYGWLRLAIAEDGAIPPGYCHFPQYGQEFFKQLTAEHLVKVVNRKTHRVTLQWEQLPNRENHQLDCRVYARAAVSVLGLDRLAGASSTPAPSTPAPPAAEPQLRPAAETRTPPRPPPVRGRFGSRR